MGSISSRPQDKPNSQGFNLPAEVLEFLASFLVGVQLICLSHSDPTVYRFFSTSQIWRPRIERHLVKVSLNDPRGLSCAEKAAYLQQRSLLFEKQPSKWLRSRRCGAFVDFPERLMVGVDRFRISLTFSVSSFGGVLFGFQTYASVCVYPPTSFLSFVSVDKRGGLRITPDKTHTTAIAAQLILRQWYQLDLVFDGRYLRAFLDGHLRYFKRMPHGFSWHELPHGQVGTGFGLDPSRTLATYTDERLAWWPFHGLIADFRVWPDSDVSSPPHPAFELKTRERHTHAKSVLSSRPCERLVEVLDHL